MVGLKDHDKNFKFCYKNNEKLIKTREGSFKVEWLSNIQAMNLLSAKAAVFAGKTATNGLSGAQQDETHSSSELLYRG